MGVYVGLIMLSAYLVQISLLLSSNWSAGFGRFFQVSALASHWLEDYENFTPTPEETTNTASTTLSAIQAARQSTFVNTQLNFTCD